MKTCTFILLALFSTLATANPAKPFNIAYVEVNSNQLTNAGCYLRASNDKPFFDYVGIFAANINGSDPNSPEIYFNPQVDNLLNRTNQVSVLQAQGVKVLLTLLGNHENAGWACMTDEKAIKAFANDVVNVVQKYKLDGIDIDDEYSICQQNDTSMIRITQAIKKHPRFKGKILTKALFADYQHFTSTYNGSKLADFLDYGWEMSYDGNPEGRLAPYVNYGADKLSLGLGLTTGQSSSSVANAVRYVLQNNYGGVMVYNVRNNSFNMLNELSLAEDNQSLKVLPNCLS